jgi:transposase
LSALVQEDLSADPFCGTIYVFRAKRANRIKVLWWDGTGICLLTTRLEEGQFRWPRIADGVMRLSAAQLSAARANDPVPGRRPAHRAGRARHGEACGGALGHRVAAERFSSAYYGL